jgi:hypothetical protein
MRLLPTNYRGIPGEFWGITGITGDILGVLETVTKTVICNLASIWKKFPQDCKNMMY